jgi:hypothetical protein
MSAYKYIFIINIHIYSYYLQYVSLDANKSAFTTTILAMPISFRTTYTNKISCEIDILTILDKKRTYFLFYMICIFILDKNKSGLRAIIFISFIRGNKASLNLKCSLLCLGVFNSGKNRTFSRLFSLLTNLTTNLTG